MPATKTHILRKEENEMSETNNETTATKKSNKTLKIVLGVVIAAVVLGALALVYYFFGPKTSEGSKEVIVEVVDMDANITSYTEKTDAEYLIEVLDELAEQGLTYSGTESEYGLMIDTINGVRADYTLDNAYWSFYLNDEYATYGVSEQPVTDGDTFRIEYTLAE